MARRTTRGLERVELRPLRRSEQRLLAAKLRDLKLPARLHQRYRIITAARSGDSVPTVARRVGCAVSVAYLWVDRFNRGCAIVVPPGPPSTPWSAAGPEASSAPQLDPVGGRQREPVSFNGDRDG